MFKAATPIGRGSRASTAPAAPGTTLSSGRSSQLGSQVGTARRLFTPNQRVRFPVIPASYGPTPPSSASFSPPGSSQFSPPRSKPATPKIAFQQITPPGSKQLSPPGSYQVTPPGSKQVTPPGSKQVTPPGSKQVTPPGSKPASPPAKSASADLDLPSSRTTPGRRQSLDDFFPKKPQIFWYDRYGFPKHLEVKKCRRSHTVDLLSDSTQVFPEAYIFQPYLSLGRPRPQLHRVPHCRRGDLLSWDHRWGQPAGYSRAHCGGHTAGTGGGHAEVFDITTVSQTTDAM
uniref:Uncharacterized protein n=1 Tax=Branchiostoma floridae TaxID=7739 RepID=C3ZXL2_BRAFL|eukprot:XP_002586725.1 hypothetical protein BRAFLDRAFT_121707 [Branchiostoma floridae]